MSEQLTKIPSEIIIAALQVLHTKEYLVIENIESVIYVISKPLPPPLQEYDIRFTITVSSSFILKRFYNGGKEIHLINTFSDYELINRIEREYNTVVKLLKDEMELFIAGKRKSFFEIVTRREGAFKKWRL